MIDLDGRLLLGLALAGMVGGCKLVDQRTFAAPGERPTPSQLAAAEVRRHPYPLVTLRLNGAAFDYKPVLKQAIDDAEERKSDVQYQVVAVVPATGDAASQKAALMRTQGNAVEIMTAMADDGVEGDRMHLSARTDAAIDAPQVQVFAN